MPWIYILLGGGNVLDNSAKSNIQHSRFVLTIAPLYYFVHMFDRLASASTAMKSVTYKQNSNLGMTL